MALLSPLRSQIFAHGSEWYEISDSYDGGVTGFIGDYEYYGYVNSIGKWIIQQHQLSTGNYRYINGISSYSTAWGIRGTLNYDYYYKMSNTTP
jgi:hypothetical protein